MIYTYLGGSELTVYDTRGDILYYNETARRVDVFDCGNLVVSDESSVTLISETQVTTFNKLVDYEFCSLFVLLIEKRHNTVCASIFNDELNLESVLYLVDNSFWAHVNNMLQLLFPFNVFEVTGYSDGRLYGYKKGKTYLFDLKSRVYQATKKVNTNIIDLLKGRRGE